MHLCSATLEEELRKGVSATPIGGYIPSTAGTLCEHQQSSTIQNLTKYWDLSDT